MSGEVDTTALIIAICVIVPALIGIGVCAIIYFAHRNKDRKLQRPTSMNRAHEDAPSSYDYPRARERESRNVYTIDFSRASRYQPPSPPRRPRPPPPIIEQAPPSYDVSIKETRREVKPRFSSVRTIPSSNQVRRSSPVISPSIYSTMPPSYAEIFLTTHTSANG